MHLNSVLLLGCYIGGNFHKFSVTKNSSSRYEKIIEVEKICGIISYARDIEESANVIRIAIVDDEIEQIRAVHQIVEAFFKEKGLKISVDTYTSGEKLLADTGTHHLIFLDIQMRKLNGIETAQRLRVNDKSAVLFFITSYQDYIQKSMTIHPFAFLVKPVSETALRTNLEDYLTYINTTLEKRVKKTYSIHTVDNRRFQVIVDDILYFHYFDNRTVKVVMKTESYLVKDSIMHVYNALNADYFVMPNQSFIVNLHYVKEIDGKNKKLVMENGDLILISRRRYMDVMEAVNRYISEEV